MLPLCRDIESWGCLHRTPATRWLRTKPGRLQSIPVALLRMLPLPADTLHGHTPWTHSMISNLYSCHVCPFVVSLHGTRRQREVEVHFRAAISWRNGSSVHQHVVQASPKAFDFSCATPPSLRNSTAFQNAPAGAPEGGCGFYGPRPPVGDLSFECSALGLLFMVGPGHRMRCCESMEHGFEALRCSAKQRRGTISSIKFVSANHGTGPFLCRRATGQPVKY